MMRFKIKDWYSEYLCIKHTLKIDDIYKTLSMNRNAASMLYTKMSIEPIVLM